MQRRVRVGAAHGLLVGRNDVVVVIALPVVAHGAVLGDLGRILLGQKQLSVHGLCRPAQQLHSVHGLAHIAAAAGGNMRQGPIFSGQFRRLLAQLFQGDLQVSFYLSGFYRFKLKDSTAAKNGIVDVEIGVLRCGGNESNGTVLNVFQQGLLLLFIEILDFIKI